MGNRSISKVFGPFRLDVANQCLWRANSRILLAPKTFAVLQHLVEHAGQLVTQEQLLEALWPDTFVQPEVLRRYILEIRRVLEDPAKAPRFIETLPKRGYRFIAPIESDAGAPAPPATPAAPPSNLVGRDAELSELSFCLRAAAGGQRQTLFVTGEPGIGKTSLVDAFHARTARTGGVRIARGQCVEGFGGKESYYPVLEAFGLFMRDPEGAALPAVLAAHAPTWLIQFPALVGKDERERLRREIVGATHERMLREICEALEVFTADHPLLLVLEDIHLADDSTLDLVSALARRRVPAKLMLLATYRPADVILSRSHLKELKQDLLIHRLCRELSLSPLTREEVAAYLNGEFPASQLERDLSGLIHESSDGNPLFMVALLERLLRQGRIAREGNEWVLTVPLGQIDPGVPETLQQMLEMQLEHLSASEQHLLRSASVSGRRFLAWAVAAMTETGEVPVEQACEGLCARQQFIRSAGTQRLPAGAMSAQYEFKHSLYREVLYSRLPPTQRQQFHLRLAERAESMGAAQDPALASEMAAHFEAGHDLARAARYLAANAELAALRFAHADAIQMLRHALDLSAYLPAGDRPNLEIAILERLSDVLYAQGDMAQSAEVDFLVARVAEKAGLKAAEIRAWTRVARALAFQDPERCIAVCEKAVEGAAAHGDPLLQARAGMLRACWQIVTNGWNARDGEACRAALARVRGLSVEIPAYYEILYAHVQCVEGDYEGACRTAADGIPKSLETGSLVVFLSAHSSLAHALFHLGRWGGLLEVVSTALTTAEKNGNAPWTGIFRAVLGWLRYQAGDLAGAQQIAEELLRTNTEEPAGQVRTMATVVSGFVWLARGVPAEAVECFRRVTGRTVHPRFFLDWYWRMAGQVGLSEALLAAGETVQADAEAATAVAAALSTADEALKARAWEVQARIAESLGDSDRADQSIGHALEALRRQEIPYAAWRVHAAAAALCRSRGIAPLAEEHRLRAAAIIKRLADSFRDGELLRESLLGAGAGASSARPW